MLVELLKRLGAAAGCPKSCDTRTRCAHVRDRAAQAGATIADVRVFLGHASVKATSIYLASGEERQEQCTR